MAPFRQTKTDYAQWVMAEYSIFNTTTNDHNIRNDMGFAISNTILAAFAVIVAVLTLLRKYSKKRIPDASISQAHITLESGTVLAEVAPIYEEETLGQDETLEEDEPHIEG